jgi:hypothetical protein
MNKNFLISALSLALLSQAPTAHATTLEFSVTGRENGSWVQNSDPVVGNFYGPGFFTQVPVSLALDSTSSSSFDSVLFLTSVAGGGFGTVNGPISENGPQIFSGAEAAPHFAPGVFDLSSGDKLTISAVPLPASFYMFATAIMALTGLSYLRMRNIKNL